MARATSKLMGENTKTSKSTDLKDALVRSLSFEKQQPLDPTLNYVIVPQKNFAAEYNIEGVTRISPRLWIVGIDGNNVLQTIRSVSINSLLGMAFQDVVDGTPAPEIKAILKPDGGYKPQQGWKYVHALDDSSFLKAEGKRAVVRKPIILRSLGNFEVWRGQFTDQKLTATNGYIDLTTDSMRKFRTDGVPSDAVVQQCVEALKAECGDDFYPLS